MLAPEDIARGDFVTILAQLSEYPTFHWCPDLGSQSPDELIRIWWHIRPDHEIHKVVAICLPLLLVKNSAGEYSQLDVRQYQLARLARGYARLVWKKTKPPINS